MFAGAAPSDPGRRARRGEGSEAAGSRSPVRASRSDAGSLEPTETDLRISVRILLHISRQPRFAPSETVPESLTQAGMAAALGARQPAISNALHRLVDGGALRVERGRVRHKLQRLKTYQLTDLGEELVRHVRRSMGP